MDREGYGFDLRKDFWPVAGPILYDLRTGKKDADIHYKKRQKIYLNVLIAENLFLGVLALVGLEKLLQ